MILMMIDICITLIIIILLLTFFASLHCLECWDVWTWVFQDSFDDYDSGKNHDNNNYRAYNYDEDNVQD